MINFSKIFAVLFPVLMLAACSEVLQSIDLKVTERDQSLQEEFDVEERTLTLTNAKAANKDPYPRTVIQTGRGALAGPISETVAIKSDFPNSARSDAYRIGIGDTLQYQALVDNADMLSEADYRFPPILDKVKYQLGIGDELSIVRLQEREIISSLGPSDDGDTSRSLFSAPTQSDTSSNIINTTGRIGSDGSILLLEVGRIEAVGKTLSEVRAEVRNILILNGLSPRFQLEISRFASQKAFLTINARSSVITLTDQVANLRDVLANAGKGVQTGITTLVTLKRDGQSYTMRLRDILALDAKAINIKANDDIIVTDRTSSATTTRAIVGSDGSVVLPSIGKVVATGKTLDDLRAEVLSILKGTPNLNEAIQLDVVDFKSQSALLNIVGRPGAVIPITSRPQLLKEALTQSGVTLDPEKVVRITLERGGKTFRFNFSDLLNTPSQQTYVYAGDQITVDVLPYKPNKVFVLGGISPTIVPIDPKIRESLADILFTPNGVLSSPSAKRSEVYLLRGNSPIRAYHLDAQNPTRLVVADAMELRPNDILYVAEQPIVSFNRTLASITPLRILLRDIQDDNIP